MLLLFFLVSFNYNILRTIKDTVVVTGEGAGVEVIPFIKFWVMFPCSILMTIVFTRLSNRFSTEKVFYIILSIFLSFFFIFIVFLYPAREHIHPHAMANTLQAALPVGFKGFIALFRNWSFTLFYVMAELWSNIVFFLLLWGFVNQVTPLHEAKRFYAMFGVGANCSGILAGQVSVYLSQLNGWEQTLDSLIGITLLNGIGIMFLLRWLNKRVYHTIIQEAEIKRKELGKEKIRISLRASLKELFKSRYLFYIALVMIAYNVSINLIENTWKDRIYALYHDPREYNQYINQVSSIMGICATLGALFVSGNLIRIYGWTIPAMLTPAVLFVTSIVFFGIYFSNDYFEGMMQALLGFSPLAFIVLIGSIQNIFCRSAKYTVFDATKEMAFIPLDQESKVRGKAAVDGVCNRMGKSLGSAIQSILVISFSSIAASAPYVAMILFVVLGGWMLVVYLLGKEFTALTATEPVSRPQPREVLSVGS